MGLKQRQYCSCRNNSQGEQQQTNTSNGFETELVTAEETTANSNNIKQIRVMGFKQRQ